MWYRHGVLLLLWGCVNLVVGLLEDLTYVVCFRLLCLTIWCLCGGKVLVGILLLVMCLLVFWATV